MEYPPLGSEIDKCRIRNEQTDGKKEKVHGKHNRGKKSEAQILDTVTVLLLYIAAIRLGMFVANFKRDGWYSHPKNKKNNGKEDDSIRHLGWRIEYFQLNFSFYMR